MAQSHRSSVTTKIDFERDGYQTDYLRVPYSSNESAYGWLPIPIICIKDGTGPTLLLTAGTHGDEYEGQVALSKMARELRNSDISGRIILLPTLNAPACSTGDRVSPIDGGNLNRLFPGDPDGSPTQVIADYLTNVLLPLSDVVVDLHAGGRSLDHLEIGFGRASSPERQKAIRQLMDVFGLPYNMLTLGEGGAAGHTLSATGEQLGIPTISVELGSAGRLSTTGINAALEGIARTLRHYGIVQDIDVVATTATKHMQLPTYGAAIYALADGLFEPNAVCGDEVHVGDRAGFLHAQDEFTKEPQELIFEASGTVMCRRATAPSKRGDCLYVVIQSCE